MPCIEMGHIPCQRSRVQATGPYAHFQANSHVYWCLSTCLFKIKMASPTIPIHWISLSKALVQIHQGFLEEKYSLQHQVSRLSLSDRISLLNETHILHSTPPIATDCLNTHIHCNIWFISLALRGPRQILKVLQQDDKFTAWNCTLPPSTGCQCYRNITKQPGYYFYVNISSGEKWQMV